MQVQGFIEYLVSHILKKIFKYLRSSVDIVEMAGRQNLRPRHVDGHVKRDGVQAQAGATWD